MIKNDYALTNFTGGTAIDKVEYLDNVKLYRKLFIFTHQIMIKEAMK